MIPRHVVCVAERHKKGAENNSPRLFNKVAPL